MFHDGSCRDIIEGMNAGYTFDGHDGYYDGLLWMLSDDELWLMVDEGE